MGHKLRFFRFNHRTHIATDKELTIEEFFAERDDKKSNNNEDIQLLEDNKSRP